MDKASVSFPASTLEVLALVLALALALLTGAAACVPADREPTSETPPAATPATPAALPDRLAAVESWAFAIGDGTLDGGPDGVAARLGVFDLVVVDGEEATTEEIAALQAHGAIVLGYLSVGTIEPWRSWYPRVEPYRLEEWEQWDEYYADVSSAAYRAVVTDEIAPAILEKGFDGLFLDNIDMPATHPGTAGAMYELVDALSQDAHKRGTLLFAQNGDDVFDGSFWELLDGWNREDVTWTYDPDAEEYVRVPAEEHQRALEVLAHFRETGMLTLTTDYTASAGSAAEAECVDAARSVGALPYVSDAGLARVPKGALGEE